MDNMVIRNAKKVDVRQIAEILVEDWQKAYYDFIVQDRNSGSKLNLCSCRAVFGLPCFFFGTFRPGVT